MDIHTQLQIISNALSKTSNLKTENEILQSKLKEKDILLAKQEETLKKLNDIYCLQHEDPQIKNLTQENKELQRKIICCEIRLSKLESSINGFNLDEKIVRASYESVGELICSRSTIDVIEYLLPKLNKANLDKKRCIRFVKDNSRIKEEDQEKIISLLEID